MADFMTNFDNQRQAYLEHYGVKGMRWGVINEQEPMGQYPQGQAPDSGMMYSPEDRKYMEKQAAYIQRANEKAVKQHRREVRKKIIKGVATAAIIGAIAVAGIKGYAKKQTGQSQRLGEAVGIIGNKAKTFGVETAKGFQTGWNMDIGKTLKKNLATEQRMRDKRDAELGKKVGQIFAKMFSKRKS